MIPKILHFCFGMTADFGGKPFGLAHYVCVRSALEQIQPSKAFVWYEHEPQTEWWKAILPKVTAMKLTAPTTIFGNLIRHPAHRADVVRLEKLIEHGGVYLDCDMLVRKSFDDLLDHRVVLGRQSPIENFGIPNAVILAEPNAKFLTRWYEEYRTFRGDRGRYWDEHSVVLPLHLSRRFPNEVTVLDHRAFYWPSWTAADVAWVFDSTRTIDAPTAYAHHLWETKSWRYLDGLTPADVRRVDTNFHRWARPYVEGFPDGEPRPWAKRRRSRAYLLRERALQWVRDRKAALVPIDVSRFSM